LYSSLLEIVDMLVESLFYHAQDRIVGHYR
jgi:hypothetical protein